MPVLPVLVTTLVLLASPASPPTAPSESSPAAAQTGGSGGQEKPPGDQEKPPSKPSGRDETAPPSAKDTAPPSAKDTAPPSAKDTASPSAKDKEPVLDADAVLRRVGAMEPAQQQEWLREIEDRLDRACRTSFNAKEAQKKKASYTALLHQKTISWEKLRDLVRETDRREKIAIVQLRSTYRIRVLETFPNQPAKYYQRQEALTKVLRAWSQAGTPFSQQGKLIAWMDEAVVSCTGGTMGPLPEDPVFESEAGLNSPDSAEPSPEPTPGQKQEPKQTDQDPKQTDKDKTDKDKQDKKARAGQEKSNIILHDLPR